MVAAGQYFDSGGKEMTREEMVAVVATMKTAVDVLKMNLFHTEADALDDAKQTVQTWIVEKTLQDEIAVRAKE